MSYQKSILGKYLLLGTYFGLLFFWIFLKIVANLYFPLIIFIISTICVCIYLISLSSSPYPEIRHSPDKLKYSLNKKIQFYIFLFALILFYFLLFIPLGFTELILEIVWLGALCCTGFVFSEMEYLWENVLNQGISFKEVSKFHIFYFLVWIANNLLGYFLFYYFIILSPIVSINMELVPIYSSFFFISGSFALIWLFYPMEYYWKIKSIPNKILLDSMDQIPILSRKFNNYVFIPLLLFNTILLVLFIPSSIPGLVINAYFFILFMGGIFSKKFFTQKTFSND